MAELVTEAILSAAFEKLFERLVSQVFANFFRGKKPIDDQLRDLTRKLVTARLLISDTETRQISEKSVRKWLDDFEDTALRAEARSKLERDQSGSMSRSIIMRYISSDQFSDFDKNVQCELALILEGLDDVLERAVVLGLRNVSHAGLIPLKLRLPAPPREERCVYGREVDRENVLKLLRSVDADKIGVLPIVGMGGVGKTTLAQLVYHDDRVTQRDFQLKAWVNVSTIEFDIFRIMRTILQQVDCRIASDVEEPVELQRRLKEALGGRKFLFVLDGVWSDDYSSWDFLKSVFRFNECGSRIIVTTCSQMVASIATTGSIYRLGHLFDDCCWKIFVDHAFNGDFNSDKRFQGMAKKIFKKCRGLPLAAKSLGG